jgi:hypothetical protein
VNCCCLPLPSFGLLAVGSVNDLLFVCCCYLGVLLDPAFLLAIELAWHFSGFAVSRWALSLQNVYIVYWMKILCHCDCWHHLYFITSFHTVNIMTFHSWYIFPDMINMMRLEYVPLCCEWIHSPGDAIAALAVWVSTVMYCVGYWLPLSLSPEHISIPSSDCDC